MGVFLPNNINNTSVIAEHYLVDLIQKVLFGLMNQFIKEEPK
jgi:hypothetical protein